MVVSVIGEVDLAAIPRLGELLKHRLAAFTHVVVVDLSRVSFLNCAGVELLCWCQQRAEHRSIRMGLVHDDDGKVGRILRLAAVDRYFAHFSDVEQALNAPDTDRGYRTPPR